MRSRLLGLPLIGLALLPLSGCGSSSSSGNGEDAKTADQIASDAAAAFAQQSSVHEEITATDADGTSTGTLDASQTVAHLLITVKGMTQTILVIGNDAFLGSDGSFSQLPATDAQQITFLLIPRQAACFAKRHGAFSKGAVSTVNGKRVIELKDDGRAPGAEPGSTFVSLDGPPLPLQSTIQGPETPGGDSACGASDTNTTTSGTRNFDYSRPAPQVTPPPASSSGATSTPTDTGTATSSNTSTDIGSSASSTDTGTSSSSSSS